MSTIALHEASLTAQDSIRVTTAPDPLWLRTGQVPSLDGLRAMSITMVIISHMCGRDLIPDEGRWGYIRYLGPLGVDVFFVISGFLITLLLLREETRKHAISLKSFYIRRILRIVPAYLFFLVGIGVLCTLGSIALTNLDWLGVATYTLPFMRSTNWNIGHIWSLSVEEHFYFLWPACVYFAPKRAWIGALAVILSSPFVRWAVLLWVPQFEISFCTLTRMDTIAVGCCLAYLAYTRAFRKLMQFPLQFPTLSTGVLMMVVATSMWIMFRSEGYRIIGHSAIVASAFAAAIWIWINCDNAFVGRILNWKPVTVLGMLSYSIYLWQQPFLRPNADEWYVQTPWNLILIAIFATLSYVAIERPVLCIKELATPKTT